MNLSRRAFLKSLAALGIISTLPPIQINAKQKPDISALTDNELIDSLITEDTPFGWITLNGERVVLTEISGHVNQNAADSYWIKDAGMYSGPLLTCTCIDFGCDDRGFSVVSRYMELGRAIDFEVNVFGWDLTVVGKQAFMYEINHERGWSGTRVTAKIKTFAPLLIRQVR